MFNTTQMAIVILSFFAILACTEEGSGGGASGIEPEGAVEAGDHGVIEIDTTEPTENLSPEAEAELLYMREEEKLARDVYHTLAAQWGVRVFSNIERAEQMHMDALLEQLERFGLEDPITDDAVGVFSDPALAELYADLVGQGSESEMAALVVGATIEDLDIRDLQTASALTDDASLAETYSVLECGSRNHLRAFMGQIERQEGDYGVQFMDPVEFGDVLASDHEGCTE